MTDTVAISTLGLFIVSFVAGCSSPPPADSLQGLTTTYLKRAIDKQAPGLPVADSDGAISVGNRRLAVTPIVETQTSRDGKTLLALRFEVAIDGAPDPRYTTGAIGIGDNTADARETAVKEWAAAFALPFVSAILARPPTHTAQRHQVYAGLLGLRGQLPAGHPLPTVLSEDNLVSEVENLLPKPGTTLDITTVHVMLAISPDGSLDGQCRKNGIVWPELQARLKSLGPLPNPQPLLAKQYFLFVPRRP